MIAQANILVNCENYRTVIHGKNKIENKIYFTLHL